jgi:hypothetical protein
LLKAAKKWRKNAKNTNDELKKQLERNYVIEIEAVKHSREM